MTQSGPMIISPEIFSRQANESSETLVCRGNQKGADMQRKGRKGRVCGRKGEREEDGL